jgi:hypothetical protein
MIVLLYLNISNWFLKRGYYIDYALQICSNIRVVFTVVYEFCWS